MIDISRTDYAMTPAERRAVFKRPAADTKRRPAPIGTGPPSETCGSCANLYRRAFSKTYLKCELMRATWTGGAATDVKARDAACARWAVAKPPERA